MKIKKYVVRNINEALSQIKSELGKDAYILSTRKIKKKSKMNLKETEMVEITAATDKAFNQDNTLSSRLLNKKYINPVEPVEPESKKISVKMPRIDRIDSELIPLKNEISEIKALIRKVGGDFQRSEIEFKGIFLECYLNLIENGVEKGIAKKVINTLVYQVKSEKYFDKKIIKKKLFDILNALISTPSPIKLGTNEKKIVILVGPTGVGKTTTIAKLSSYFKLRKSTPVTLLSIDSFRIGAEAHLRTYANLLNVPFYQIYSKNDLLFRLRKLQGDQLVFIDTTGRNANDTEALKEMKSMLSLIPAEDKTTLLVVSANVKSRDLYNTYKQYSLFGIDKMIFSKMDETMTLGNLFNLKVKTNVPAAYFTTGQRVPEDIEMAYPAKITNKLISSQGWE